MIDIKFIIFIAVAVAIATAIGSVKGKGRKKKNSKVSKYKYLKKPSVLTSTESKFLHILKEVVGEKYLIFPQIHISSLVEHKVKGQNWNNAFSHINGKSVDFVLCDPKSLNTTIAIELDDSSHGRDNRKKRDIEVERIFEEAGVRLERIKVGEDFESRIKEILIK